MHIVCFSVSLRREASNGKLIAQAEQIAQKQGVQTELLDLNEYIMPYYNQDIQQDPKQGIPEAAKQLDSKLKAASGVIISSPEYNFSMPGHFKNTFDWMSRMKPTSWHNKPVLLLSASPSLIGGNRGLWSLRQPLESVGTFVFPNMFSLSNSYQEFNDNNQLSNPELARQLEKLIEQFLTYTQRLSVKS